MLKPELYHKTIGILVKAYLNGNLKKGECHACMVGNLINHYKPFSKQEKQELKHHESGWVMVFCTINSERQDINHCEYTGKAKEQIDSTGYSYLELAKCEYAFETAPLGEDKDETMFNGLMASVEALGQIHECDKETINESKLMFVK